MVFLVQEPVRRQRQEQQPHLLLWCLQLVFLFQMRPSWFAVQMLELPLLLLELRPLPLLKLEPIILQLIQIALRFK